MKIELLYENEFPAVIVDFFLLIPVFADEFLNEFLNFEKKTIKENG